MATLEHNIKVIQAVILKGEGNKKQLTNLSSLSQTKSVFQRNSSAPTPPTGLPNGEGVNGVND